MDKFHSIHKINDGFSNKFKSKHKINDSFSSKFISKHKINDSFSNKLNEWQHKNENMMMKTANWFERTKPITFQSNFYAERPVTTLPKVIQENIANVWQEFYESEFNLSKHYVIIEHKTNIEKNINNIHKNTNEFHKAKLTIMYFYDIHNIESEILFFNSKKRFQFLPKWILNKKESKETIEVKQGNIIAFPSNEYRKLNSEKKSQWNYRRKLLQLIVCEK